jgi:hypothetical protein
MFLLEFAVAVEQLAHWAPVGLPQDFIQREAACSFVDGVKDWDVKQHLLSGGERSLNEALNQALKLETVKAAATPPTPLKKLTAGPTKRTWSPATEPCRTGQPICWQCADVITSEKTFNRDVVRSA